MDGFTEKKKEKNMDNAWITELIFNLCIHYTNIFIKKH